MKPLTRFVEAFNNERGKAIGTGFCAAGVIGLGLLLGVPATGILPFFSQLFTGLGVNLLTGSGRLSEKEIEEFSKLVEECAAKSKEELQAMVAELRRGIGDEFNELKGFLPEEFRAKFDALVADVKRLVGFAERAEEDHEEIKEMLTEALARVIITADRIFVFGYRPTIDGIHGRDGLADEYTKLLSEGSAHVLWLHGMGGIGKSTLASMVFSRLSSDDPEAARFKRLIWYDLKEHPDPETPLFNVVSVLTDRRVPPAAPAQDQPLFDQHLNILATRVSQKPVFLVLDNIDNAMGASGEFADHRWPRVIRAFSGSGSALIVTSRPFPSFVEAGCVPKPISGIGRNDAIALMREEGLRDSDDVLEDAWKLLRGHPMALRALAATVRRTPRWRGMLANAGEIMDAVRACPDPERNPIVLFEGIIHPDRLPAPHFALLTAMPVFFRPEKAEAIAALRHELDADQVPEYLDDLVNWLVEIETETSPCLYSLHPLVEEVAKKQTDDPTLLHKRAYDYYLSLPCEPDTKDPREVLHLIEAVKHAFAIKDLKRSDAVLYGKIGLTRRLAGWGRYDIALPLHKSELEIAEEVGDQQDRMHAAGRLGQCLSSTGDYIRSLDHLKNALDIAVEIGDRGGEGVWRGTIGQIHKARGEYDEALKWLYEALDIAVEIGDRRNEGVWRTALGEVLITTNRPCEAISHFERALELTRELGLSRYLEGGRRNLEEARRACEESKEKQG